MLNHYAKSADQAEYPTLWNGLVAAYVPGLLPSETFIHSLIPGSFPATAYGPTIKHWRGQRCLYFDGVDDYAQATSASRMNSSPTVGGITACVWVAATDNQAAYSRILEKGANTNWSIDWYYAIQGEIEVHTGWSNLVQSNISHLDGQWHLVVLRAIWFSGVDLFIDGDFVGNFAVPGTGSSLDGADLYFGRHGGGGYFGKHYMSDALIYDRALSGAEISLLYSLGPNGFATPRKRSRIVIEQAEAPATRVQFLTLLGVS